MGGARIVNIGRVGHGSYDREVGALARSAGVCNLRYVLFSKAQGGMFISVRSGWVRTDRCRRVVVGTRERTPPRTAPPMSVEIVAFRTLFFPVVLESEY